MTTALLSMCLTEKVTRSPIERCIPSGRVKEMEHRRLPSRFRTPVRGLFLGCVCVCRCGCSCVDDCGVDGGGGLSNSVTQPMCSPSERTGGSLASAREGLELLLFPFDAGVEV